MGGNRDGVHPPGTRRLRQPNSTRGLMIPSSFVSISSKARSSSSKGMRWVMLDSTRAGELYPEYNG